MFFLERVKATWDRFTRKDINDNFEKIEKNFNNVVDVVSKRAYNQVVDAAKLIWQEPVNTFSDLATTYPNPKEGWASMARDTGVVYRYNSHREWKPAQEISAGPFNEMDHRLSTQLAQTENYLSALTVDIRRFGADVNADVATNTQAIQDAINYVSARGGGDVFVPAGTFNHTTVILPANVRLRGVGKASVLKNTTDATSIVVGAANYTFDTTIVDLYLRGSDTNNFDINKSNQHAIVFAGVNPAYCKITNVHIYYFGGHGILGGHQSHVNNVEITGCFIEACGLDGINMQYNNRTDGGAGQWQINAIWIRDNNIVKCRVGVVFYGNNVIVESNTIQDNVIAGVALSDDTSPGVKYCLSSAIINNYFELNGKNQSNASVIYLYHGNVNTSNGRYIRNLAIKNNYIAERTSNYKSIIDIVSQGTNTIISNTCVIDVSNNTSEYGIPIVSINNDAALSRGSSISVNAPSMLPILPAHVKISGSAAEDLISDNNPIWRHSKIIGGYTANQTYTVTVYLDTSLSNLQLYFDTSILTAKFNGQYSYGNPGRFAMLAKYYTSVRLADDVVIKNASESAGYIPTMTPISYTTYNGKPALQFSFTPIFGGNAVVYLEMDVPRECHRFLKVVLA